jgi:rod shape-determining protein MreC
MPAALKSFVQWLVYAGLIVFAGGVMLLGKADAILVERIRLQVNDTVVPILDVLSVPVDTFADGLERVQLWIDVAEENARLRDDRERLLRWQAVAKRLDAENAQLRQLLNVVPEPDAIYRAARVVADSTGAFAHSLMLNAGNRAGIEKGQIVQTGDGLVGRIVGVSQRASRVLLITDLNSRVPVVVGQSRVRAVLAGDNSERPKLIHVVPGVAIAANDEVVTSGIAGAFPPGLPVGVVADVDDARIRVTPNIKRDQLEYVRVVDYGEDAPQLERSIAANDESSARPTARDLPPAPNEAR